MITLAGPLATYFNAVQVAANDWRLEAIAIPAPGRYAYTLTEAQNGYDNTPKISTGSLTIEPEAGTGIMTVTSERTIVVTRMQANTAVGAGIPLGAPGWRQQFDPGDHAPFAIDFSQLLLDGEEIAQIDAITMSSQAAALGIGIDPSSPYSPIIDQDGRRKVQVWFIVNDASKMLSQFDDGGVKMTATFRIKTNSVPPVTWERTGVLTVRQL